MAIAMCTVMSISTIRYISERWGQTTITQYLCRHAESALSPYYLLHPAYTTPMSLVFCTRNTVLDCKCHFPSPASLMKGIWGVDTGVDLVVDMPSRDATEEDIILRTMMPR